MCMCLYTRADFSWRVRICFVFTLISISGEFCKVNSLLDNKLSCKSQSGCHGNKKSFAIQAIYLHAKRILCISNIILKMNAGRWKSP